jgi:hypothetical protein
VEEEEEEEDEGSSQMSDIWSRWGLTQMGRAYRRGAWAQQFEGRCKVWWGRWSWQTLSLFACRLAGFLCVKRHLGLKLLWPIYATLLPLCYSEPGVLCVSALFHTITWSEVCKQKKS